MKNTGTRPHASAAVILALYLLPVAACPAAAQTPAASDALRVAEEALQAFDRGKLSVFVDYVNPKDLSMFRETWEPVVRQVERRSPVPEVMPEFGGPDADRTFVRHFLARYTSENSSDGSSLSHRVIGEVRSDSITAYIVYERAETTPNVSRYSILVLPLTLEHHEWRVRLTEEFMRVNNLLCTS